MFLRIKNGKPVLLIVLAIILLFALFYFSSCNDSYEGYLSPDNVCGIYYSQKPLANTIRGKTPKSYLTAMGKYCPIASTVNKSNADPNLPSSPTVNEGPPSKKWGSSNLTDGGNVSDIFISKARAVNSARAGYGDPMTKKEFDKYVNSESGLMSNSPVFSSKNGCDIYNGSNEKEIFATCPGLNGLFAYSKLNTRECQKGKSNKPYVGINADGTLRCGNLSQSQ
jgi:hypothetical protein